MAGAIALVLRTWLAVPAALTGRPALGAGAPVAVVPTTGAAAVLRSTGRRTDRRRPIAETLAGPRGAAAPSCAAGALGTAVAGRPGIAGLSRSWTMERDRAAGRRLAQADAVASRSMRCVLRLTSRTTVAACARRSVWLRAGPAEAAAEDRLRPDRPIGLEASEDLLGDGLPEHELDLVQELALVDAHERHGVARRTGTTGPADAVDVVLGDHRQLEVDDVRQSIDIEAAGSYL